ncbi:MAG TPA: hypothetical protein VLK25_05180 [Allosphingosinicella sp.]|nr:hypothetical protein [Allosphingosinicella sp.]
MENDPIGTASVSWLDSCGQVHLRVYSSDGYNVIERCWDSSGAWTNGGFNAPGDQVSATCWQSSAGANIRVYCNFEGKTVEYCWDAGGSGWYQGAYTTE